MSDENINVEDIFKQEAKKSEEKNKAKKTDDDKTNEKTKKKKTVKKKVKKKITSKRLVTARSLIDKEKSYPISEAIALVKKTSTTKFDGSIEVHFRLGIDVKKGDQQIRGTVSLPYGTGKSKKIAAFAIEENAKKATSAGADLVGGEELIQKIKQTGKIDFDIAVTTPEMMPKMAMIAKILGPKGLMPSPKNETITKDIEKTIGELKKGKIAFKNDSTANVHVTIGRTSFDEKHLLENFNVLFSDIKKSKPSSSKGVYLKNVSINATMGPGIKIAV